LVGRVPAGVVDETVEAAEALDGSLDKPAHVLFLPHVAVDEERLAHAFGARQLLQVARDGPAALLVVAADDNPCARADELIRAALADAAAAAGDDQDLVGVPRPHPFSPPCVLPRNR